MKHLLISGMLLATVFSGNAALSPSFCWTDAGLGTAPAMMEKAVYAPPQSPDQLSTVSIDLGNTAVLSSMPVVTSAGEKAKSVTSMNDLTGTYVMTSLSCVGYGTPGREVSVSVVPGTDSIAISGFWSAGMTVKAKVDISSMSVTIPSQYLYTHTTYGKMDLSAVTNNGVPLRNDPIKGSINSDGTISFETWWCVAVNEGEQKDEIVDANRSTVLERPNATMTYTPAGSSALTFAVVASQTSSNIVRVKNFANRGATIEISLTGDRGGSISSQTAYINNQGTWVTIGTPTLNDTGQLVSYTPAITLNTAAASDNRTISWGKWAIYLPNKSYSGLLTSATVTTDFDITYPPEASATLAGAGTEADPYKISSLADIILLAQMVNTDTDRSGVISSSTQTVNYAKSQLGKFFRLTADIDMSGYRANPIGWDVIHQFCGTFDGDGHTITGLNVEAPGFAALFGMVDTEGVIKNLILDSPVIKSTSSYYAAGIAAYSEGLIEKCQVKNPKIDQQGQVAGGIVGVGRNVNDCHVTGANVYARYGFAAGVAGQINGTISNSSATDSYIAGSSSASADPRLNGGSPVGGVIGSLFKGTATGCWFSGMVDGYSLGISVYSGGIAGINHLGLVDRCFTAGTVLGTGSGSVNGGIVGFCSGRVTNSYSSGVVDCVSSYYTGGITGRLALADTTSPEPEVTNCYTTVQLRAEAYQYNPEEEMRETIGRIWTGTNPKVENVYFDNQVVNFRSVRGGLTNTQLTDGTPINGLDANVWTYTKDAYPRLTVSASSPAAQLSASAVLMPVASTTFANVNADLKLSPLGDTKFYLLKDGKTGDSGYFCSIKDNTLVINTEYKMGNDTLVADNGNSRLYYYLKIAPKFLEGEGTAEAPYLLKSKADILALATATSEKQLTFANTYFAFVNDIDMENDLEFKGISFSTSTSLRFAGVIDGRGYSLHNLNLNFVKWTTPPTETALGVLDPSNSTSYVGFVSKLGATGVVKNLTIASDCSIQGLGTVGGIVGTSYGLVENCRNYAPVTGIASGVGGIAGKLETGSKVIGCFNAGHIITGYQGVAGIAGSGTAFEIRDCANTGLIEAKPLCTARDEKSTVLKYAAGIAGNVGGVFTISNSVDYGHSSAWVGSVGSICGRSYGTPTLTGNLALGTVECKDVVSIGMMAGELPANVKYSDNFWDMQMLPWNAAASQPHDGAIGISTAVLTSGEAVKGLTDSVWSYAKGRYPVPAAMENLAEIRAAAVAYFSLPENQTVGDLRDNVTLPVTDNRVWTLEQGSAFSLSDNVLSVPKATKDLQTGSLKVAVNGIYSKTFSLSVLPAMPFDGEGTAELPYLINNANDWNMLASYMESTGESFEGKYLKITADIDFKDVKATAVAADGKTSFCGTLDGNNHSLKNISLTGSTQYLGLIGSVGAEGCIRNLTFQGTVNSTGLNVGGVAGKSAGVFENCVSEMIVTSNKTYAAGFVGLATGGAFRKCTSKAIVNTSTSNAGGFVGQATGREQFDNCVFEGTIASTSTSTSALNYGGFVGNAWPSDFTACVNKGKITCTLDRANGIAGFIGNANGAVNNGVYTFTDCCNEADLTGGYSVAGYVAGAVTTVGAAAMKFTGCENKGKITTTYSSTKATGFVCMATPGSVFTDCVNSGEIVAEGGMAAGIVATTGGTFSATNSLSLNNCSNTAAISSKGNNAGGIIASAGNFTNMNGCYNTGAIKGALYVGGLVGAHTAANGTFVNCWNSGSVDATGGRVGGLAGSMSGNPAKQGDVLVKGCFNTASVATSSTLGGTSVTTANPSGYAIGGLAGFSSGRFEDSYNMGEVKGVSRIGGLVGDPGTYKKLSMEHCYNAGKVIAPADTCGAIVGINTDNGKLWTDGLVNNTYYLVGICTSTLPVQGKEVDTAGLCTLSLGAGFSTPAENCFPIVKALEKVEAALLYSGQPIFATGQSASSVTGNFVVGCPEGVTWTLAGTTATIKDGKVEFAGTFKGNADLVATTENMSRTIPLTLNVVVSSVDELDGDSMVVSRICFTPEGIQTTLPESPDGKIYIVITTYADGTRKAVRLLNK